MGDIEDLAYGESALDAPRVDKSSLIFPKKATAIEAKKRNTQACTSGNNQQQSNCGARGSGDIPGTQKVWIKTYGCSHNVSDSEYMEGILSSYGFQISESQQDADLWLVNSCTVKDPSQAAFMHLVNKGKENSIPVVVAGCVSQADRSITGLEDVSVIGISQIDRVVEVVEQTLAGNTVKLLGKKALPSLDLPKIRKNPLVEIIPLSTGCLGSCTYCKTKHARGKLGSYQLESIVERVKTVATEGVAEIWLSSEDTGAYGLDIGTNIAELLRAVVDALPVDGVMLRVGMTNPPYMLKHLDAIADILNHPKVFSFLHVPVQAASNSVLTAMNREYTVEEFRQVVDHLQVAPVLSRYKKATRNNRSLCPVCCRFCVEYRPECLM
jgi:threonylcarbamoyladenosine tRNA methylthiotransferase CDKAL1